MKCELDEKQGHLFENDKGTFSLVLKLLKTPSQPAFDKPPELCLLTAPITPEVYLHFVSQIHGPKSTKVKQVSYL
jgi:hypothetical protein